MVGGMAFRHVMLASGASARSAAAFWKAARSAGARSFASSAAVCDILPDPAPIGFGNRPAPFTTYQSSVGIDFGSSSWIPVVNARVSSACCSI
jgi:hypothetical protein